MSGPIHDVPDERLEHLDGLPARRPPATRLLLAVAVAETLTLVVLLVNLLLTTRSSALAAAVGPVHGALYLTGVLLTLVCPFPRTVKLLAVVPVVGAWVAALRARRHARSTPDGTQAGSGSARSASSPVP